MTAQHAPSVFLAAPSGVGASYRAGASWVSPASPTTHTLRVRYVQHFADPRHTFEHQERATSHGQQRQGPRVGLHAIDALLDHLPEAGDGPRHSRRIQPGDPTRVTDLGDPCTDGDVRRGRWVHRGVGGRGVRSRGVARAVRGGGPR